MASALETWAVDTNEMKLGLIQLGHLGSIKDQRLMHFPYASSSHETNWTGLGGLGDAAESSEAIVSLAADGRQGLAGRLTSVSMVCLSCTTDPTMEVFVQIFYRTVRLLLPRKSPSGGNHYRKPSFPAPNICPSCLPYSYLKEDPGNRKRR